MKIAALVTALSAALEPLARENAGTLEVAESMEEARAFLDAAPARWRLVLLWDGYGSHPQAREGMTKHRVTTVVQQVRGLPAQPATRMLSYSERLEQVSRWMRSMRFPNGTDADPYGFSLEDSKWVETIRTCRAHAMTWELVAALPGFTDTITLAFPQT